MEVQLSQHEKMAQAAEKRRLELKQKKEAKKKKEGKQVAPVTPNKLTSNKHSMTKIRNFSEMNVPSNSFEHMMDNWRFRFGTDVYTSNYVYVDEEIRKRIKVKYFIFNENELDLCTARIASNFEYPVETFFNLPTYLKTTKIKKFALRTFENIAEDNTIRTSILADDLLEMIPIILESQGKSVDNYKDYWTGCQFFLSSDQDQVYKTYSLDDLNTALDKFDINKDVVTIVPDTYQCLSSRKTCENSTNLMTTLNSHGDVVMSLSQALTHIFVSLICGYNWKSVEESIGSEAYKDFKKQYFAKMDEIARITFTSLVTKTHVDRKLAELQSHEIFSKIRKSPSDYLWDKQQFDDTIQVSIYHEKRREFDLPNYVDKFPISEEIPVWLARFHFLYYWIEAFYGTDIPVHKLVMAKGINHKMPRGEVDEVMEFVKQITAPWMTLEIAEVMKHLVVLPPNRANKKTSVAKESTQKMQDSASEKSENAGKPESSPESSKEASPSATPQKSKKLNNLDTSIKSGFEMNSKPEHSEIETQTDFNENHWYTKFQSISMYRKEDKEKLISAEKKAKVYEMKALKSMEVEEENKKLKKKMKEVEEKDSKVTKENEKMKKELEETKKEMTEMRLKEKNIKEKLTEETHHCQRAQLEMEQLNRDMNTQRQELYLKLSHLEDDVSSRDGIISRLRETNQYLKSKSAEITNQETVTDSSEPSSLSNPGSHSWREKLLELQDIKVRFSSDKDIISEEVKRMVDGLKERTEDEDLMELADFEMFQLEKSIQIYYDTVEINIRRIKRTENISDILPLTKYPVISEDFLTAYQNEMKTIVPAIFGKFDCPICWKKREEEHEVIECGNANCHKVYHRHCIENWFNTKRTCPQCTKQFLDVKGVMKEKKRQEISRKV